MRSFLGCALILISAFNVLAQSPTAPPFATFALDRFRQGLFTYVRPTAITSAREGPVSASLTALYSKHLPSGANATSWMARSLPETLRLPQGRPVESLWNTHLVWALDAKGRRLRGFRPVDTTTECSSGCTPIVFHLSFSPSGGDLKLLEQPNEPLRKIDHAVFTQEDHARVAKILAKIPSSYESVSSPRDLTDAESAWPPRTWTFFEPTLVKGGAYTSYRIYQAALPLKRYLSGGDPAEELAEEERSVLIGDSLSLTSPDQGWKRVVALEKIIANSKSTPALRQTAQAFIPEILLWLVQFHGAQPRQLLRPLRADWMKQERVRLACGFYRDLLRSPEGARMLLGLFDEKHVPACPSLWVADLPGLAAVAASRPLPKGWNPALITQGLLKDASVARLQLKALDHLGDKEAFLDALATYRIRFPRSESFGDTAPGALAARLKSAEAKYREQLVARFLSAPETLPSVELSDLRGQKRALGPKGKQVLVFFGSWCEHCQALLRSWATAYPKELWPRTQLIETLSPQSSLAAAVDLCESAPLPKKVCAGIQQLPPPEQAPDFHNALGLHTVPRILLLDAQGRIRGYDYRYDDASEGSDPGRDLAWLIQEINKP
jgi:hypothetical protein